jgi:cysteine desulfurase
MMQLDEAGIACGLGSACSASSEQPSHVLKAIGLDDKAAQATLRFSLSPLTTMEQIDFTLKTLAQLL